MDRNFRSLRSAIESMETDAQSGMGQSISTGGGERMLDSPSHSEDKDTFCCGKCKAQFTSLQVFFIHKESACESLFIHKESACESLQAGGKASGASSGASSGPLDGSTLPSSIVDTTEAAPPTTITSAQPLHEDLVFGHAGEAALVQASAIQGQSGITTPMDLSAAVLQTNASQALQLQQHQLQQHQLQQHQLQQHQLQLSQHQLGHQRNLQLQVQVQSLLQQYPYSQQVIGQQHQPQPQQVQAQMQLHRQQSLMQQQMEQQRLQLHRATSATTTFLNVTQSSNVLTPMVNETVLAQGTAGEFGSIPVAYGSFTKGISEVVVSTNPPLNPPASAPSDTATTGPFGTVSSLDKVSVNIESTIGKDTILNIRELAQLNADSTVTLNEATDGSENSAMPDGPPTLFQLQHSQGVTTLLGHIVPSNEPGKPGNIVFANPQRNQQTTGLYSGDHNIVIVPATGPEDGPGGGQIGEIPLANIPLSAMASQASGLHQPLSTPAQGLPEASGINRVASDLAEGFGQAKERIDNGLGAFASRLRKRTHECRYCSKSFTKKYNLEHHIRGHTGEKPYRCIACGRGFSQRSNVKKHMLTHKVWPSQLSALPAEPLIIQSANLQQPGAPDEDRVVVTGSDGIASVVQPKSPLNTKVEVNTNYVCPYCLKKFKSHTELRSHLVKHKNEMVYKCVVLTCGHMFSELEVFVEHIKQAHKFDMTYRCHVCHKSFQTLMALSNHEGVHLTEKLADNRPEQAGDNALKTKKAMFPTLMYKCLKCENRYSTPEALQHHLSTASHHFNCSHCSKTFASENLLRRHLISHGTQGAYKCPTCHKHFKTDHYLRMHQLIHTGEKPFQCHICLKTFNRKDKVKRHVLTHGEKKYACPLTQGDQIACGKTFNRSDKLKEHMMTHSVTVFACPCHTAFSTTEALKKHMETCPQKDDWQTCMECQLPIVDNNIAEHTCAGSQIIHMKHGVGIAADAGKKRGPGRLPKEETQRLSKHVKRKLGRPRKEQTATDGSEPRQPKRKAGRPKKLSKGQGQDEGVQSNDRQADQVKAATTAQDIYAGGQVVHVESQANGVGSSGTTPRFHPTGQATDEACSSIEILEEEGTFTGLIQDTGSS